MSTTPSIDFDGAWKEALGPSVPAFVAFFWPKAYAAIDWSQPPDFLEQELRKISRKAPLGGRRVDKLAKVWRQDGSETWVLVHVEVQNDAVTDFAERMYVYNYRIYDRHRQRVASLAVLTDQSGIWRPDRFEYELWDSRVDFRYHMVKLRDYRERWDELEASTNPFAIVVMAHLLTKDTQRDTAARYAAKRTLLKQLYRSGLAREQILALLRFIDWIMQLPEGLEDQLWQEVQSAEEETRMTRLSYIERKSIERGLETGLQQGRQEGRQEG